VIIYRKSELVWELLTAWAETSERNFKLACQCPVPFLPSLAHILEDEVRRKLMGLDQIAMEELLSPNKNYFGLTTRVLGGEWNHRGSRLRANNVNPVKILHSPALRDLIHADLLSVAFQWRKSGRDQAGQILKHYVQSLYDSV
jgi:hypothetical protein